MSNWSDNIPEQPVLCKRKTGCGHDSHVKGKCDHGTVFDDRDYDVGLPENYTPLTHDEWWQLAPWNYDMDSAPKDGSSILIKQSDNEFEIAWWIEVSKSYWSINREILNAIAWLPLPKNK